MKLVEWKDGKEIKHLSTLRNSDDDDMARYGVSHDPPDIWSLDWNQIKVDLHNALVERRLATWTDVKSGKDSVRGAILSALHRRVIELYKMREQQEVKK